MDLGQARIPDSSGYSAAWKGSFRPRPKVSVRGGRDDRRINYPIFVSAGHAGKRDWKIMKRYCYFFDFGWFRWNTVSLGFVMLKNICNSGFWLSRWVGLCPKLLSQLSLGKTFSHMRRHWHCFAWLYPNCFGTWTSRRWGIWKMFHVINICDASHFCGVPLYVQPVCVVHILNGRIVHVVHNVCNVCVCYSWKM